MTIRHALTAAAGNTGPAPAPTDPQFNYVSMLLHGDGTNGAQNNTFLDSSSNAFSITRNGNTTQGSLSPYGNLWSNYFDGNGDYLTVPSNTAFDFGSGNFTVEGWIYINANAALDPDSIRRANICACIFDNTPASGWLFSVTGNSTTTGTGLMFDVWNSGSGTSFSASSTIPQNTWNHVAVVRNGSSISLYLNGASILSTTISVSVNSGGNNFDIGSLQQGTAPKYYWYFPGYISNLRVVKGTAVYTSAFTPPTAPLTAITNTSLLTCQSNRFIDNSANNFTITRNGDVQVTKEAPFLPTAAYSTSVIGGSGYFDGAGDWLQIANNTALQVGSNDFCIECWICPTAMPAAGTVARFMTKNTGQPTGYEWTFGITPSGQLQFVFYTINTVAVTSSSGLIAANSCWYHVAFCRSGTTFGLFCNGVRQGGTVASRAILSTTSPVAIGRDLETTGREFTGYICDARIVNGSSVYNPSSGATLTVPTAPLTAITNTSLLLNFTNAGIFDNAAENDLETVGNAQISTSVKKYGTGSLAFDGSGDWLTTGPNQAFAFGTGDWTIEFWINSTQTSRADPIGWNYSFNNAGWAGMILNVSASGQMSWYEQTSQRINATSTGWNNGSWNHIAVTRSGNSVRMFLNGTQQGSTYSTSASYGSSAGMIIGNITDGSGPLNGYIDDLRITKGYARYTANFTPPTAAFPDQ